MFDMSTLLFDFLERVERKAAFLRGKGYGTASWDREVEAALALLGRPPELVLDIGGNVGDYAVAMRRVAPHAEIQIFEPSAFCYAKLKERFSGDAQMHVERVALSDHNGEGTLYANEAGSVLGSLTRRDLAHLGIAMDTVETVPVVRLEDYWKSQLGCRKIDVVKIDVEGHELPVLKGFGSALNAASVIQFEFGGTQIDTRYYFKDYYQLLDRAGFKVFRISPLGLETIDRYKESDENFLTANYLAAKCAS